ncbi:MAG: hypothetical protein NVS3B19_10160 [Ginsengibacter sp.]
MIITLVDEDCEAQLLTFTIKLYAPRFNEVVLLIIGFCRFDEKPFGPLQLYVAPGINSAERFKVDPSQIGPLFEIFAAGGILLTTTLVVDKPEAQLFTVVIRLYLPALDLPILSIDGFCKLEVKPFGPVQL